MNWRAKGAQQICCSGAVMGAVGRLPLREIAVGRKNWLFAGSERGGEACAIVTSLIETTKAHGYDPLAYLTDVLERLPTTLNRDIESLLPMNWQAKGA